WIGAPADGFDVFSIGAVDGDGNRAEFSSIGPTADGRTKPILMAKGQGSTIADDGEGVTFGSGTSFSSPIMAGMTACLMQAYPNKTPGEIMESLKDSGNNSGSPDNYMGWGIPDFMQAFSILTIIENDDIYFRDLVNVFPNPFSRHLDMFVLYKNSGRLKYRLSDNVGKHILSGETDVRPGQVVSLSHGIDKLGDGVYFLQITMGNHTEVEKVFKVN
ncbi:MAG: S8 family serine peptidase, partial [Chlorobi bacterium]|nr:S8 family serine peptidase [Chlorobiota bacterium]